MFSTHTSLKRVLTCLILCAACILLVTGCAAPWKQAKTHKKSTANIPKPTTEQLLTAVQKNFRDVKTFHVLMQVQNTGPAQGDQVEIRNADGDVAMPDKVKAQASVVMSGQSVSVTLVSIGDDQYITDPITGQWRIIKGVLDPRTLTNPNTGVVSLVSKVQHVSEPVSSTVNNAACWRIHGQLAAKHLAFLTGGGVPPETMLQAEACIGKGDSLPYQVIITGKAAPSDTTQTARSFLLSNYNQTVNIVAPQL